MNLRFLWCVFISTCCNFLFGYHLVALNNYSFITAFDIAAVGVATSMFSVGGLAGSILAGIKMKRRYFFLACGVITGTGSLFQLLQVAIFVSVGRVLVGTLY
eukprot:NODE_214_length_14327_cov_0.392325.p10 type:complete len:102 gc:universal NODE_214_length_14327_cov_0.392325:12294-12599(+)